MEIYEPSQEERKILQKYVEKTVRKLDRYGGDIVPHGLEKKFCTPIFDPPKIEVTNYPKPCGEILLYF